MKKIKAIIRTILYTLAVLFGVALLCLVGMYLVFSPSEDEVARITSPNNKYQAVLIEINGGATTSFGYSVYVVKTGSSTFWYGSVAYLYGAIRSNQAYGVNLKWHNSDQLAIEYLKAQLSDPDVSKVEIGGDTINVQLKSGVNDPNAPAGGMFYNLKKKT